MPCALSSPHATSSLRSRGDDDRPAACLRLPDAAPASRGTKASRRPLLLGLGFSLALHALVVALTLVELPGFEFFPRDEPLEVVSLTLEHLEIPPPPEPEKATPTPPRPEETADSAPPSAPPSAPEDVALISANKTDAAPLVIQQGQRAGDIVLREGPEMRLTMRILGAETYTTEDYLGDYAIRGEDRWVRISRTGDALLFYDSRTEMLRKLTQFGDKIFTYGPSLNEATPVEGSITFLPVKHRAATGDTEIPSRLIWLPEFPPMKFGERMRFEERGVRVAGELTGQLTTPPRPVAQGWPAVVWVPDSGCRTSFDHRIVTRELALAGVAALTLSPPACRGIVPPGPGAPLVEAEHVRLGLDYLARLSGVNATALVVWARNHGVRPAATFFREQAPAAAAEAASPQPAFAVLTLETTAFDPAALVRTAAPSSATFPPTLWLTVGDAPGETAAAFTHSWDDVRLVRLTPPRRYDPAPARDLDRLKLLGHVYARAFLEWLRDRGVLPPKDAAEPEGAVPENASQEREAAP